MPREETSKRNKARSPGARSKSAKKKSSRKKATKKKAKKKTAKKKVGKKKATKKKVAKRATKKKATRKKATRKKAAKKKTAKKKAKKKKAQKRKSPKRTASRKRAPRKADEPIVAAVEVVDSEHAIESVSEADERWDFSALDWMEDALEGAAPESGKEQEEWGTAPAEILLSSSQSGDAEIVLSLIADGADLAVRDRRASTADWTATMHAAARGHGDVVRLLLESGADPNATDDPTGAHGGTVQFICRHGDLEAVEGMRLGRTACHVAATGGHTDVVRVLIENGCDVNWADHAGQTPLMLATRAGHLALARLLIQAGAAVDARDFRHTSALMMAAKVGNADLARLLLDSGAEVEAHDGTQTALMAAVAEAHADVTRVLLRAGADVDLLDYAGFGVLCFAIHAIEHFENERGAEAIRPVPEDRIQRIVEMLLEAGAADLPDATGVRPSQRASEQGQGEIAALLREYGAELYEPEMAEFLDEN